MSWRSVVALSGGVGGARLVDGLAAALPPGALAVVVNTGDDFEHWGLRVCPDLDTIMYTLAGLADEERGWGVAQESFRALDMVRRYGGPAWFQLGDRDLGTHLVRTLSLAQGARLTEVTAALCRALGVARAVVPMADAPRPTVIETRTRGALAFQDWLVRERCAPEIARIRFSGPPAPSPEAIAAIEGADLVVIGPSNPYVSIDPILALDGVREALRGRLVVAVSPIVGGRAVKGPLAEMIPQLAGRPASAAAVAAHYGDLLSGFVIERGDEPEVCTTAGRTPAVRTTATVMRGRADRERLAREVLALAEELR